MHKRHGCAHTHATASMWRWKTAVGGLSLPLDESWESNSGHWGWQQVPLPSKKSCQSPIFLIRKILWVRLALHPQSSCLWLCNSWNYKLVAHLSVLKKWCGEIRAKWLLQFWLLGYSNATILKSWHRQLNYLINSCPTSGRVLITENITVNKAYGNSIFLWE